MYYDPDEFPIRNALASYRRWIVPLTMFAPTAILINILAMSGMGLGAVTTYTFAGLLLAFAAIATCLATVWVTAELQNFKSKLWMCISTCVIILYGNFLLMAVVMGIAWLAGAKF